MMLPRSPGPHLGVGGEPGGLNQRICGDRRLALRCLLDLFPKSNDPFALLARSNPRISPAPVQRCTAPRASGCSPRVSTATYDRN
jgi:hypothetical protein